MRLLKEVIEDHELPGICTDGATIEEAIEGIKEAIEGAIELYLEQGKEIPLPIDKNKYRGNISYRTTPDRHY